MLLSHPAAPMYINKTYRISKLAVYISALVNVLAVLSGYPPTHGPQSTAPATHAWLRRLVLSAAVQHPSNTTLRITVPLEFDPSATLEFDKGSFIYVSEYIHRGLGSVMAICLLIVLLNACALSVRRVRLRKCMVVCTLLTSFLVLITYTFFSRTHTYVLSDVHIALQGEAHVRVDFACATSSPFVRVEHMSMYAAQNSLAAYIRKHAAPVSAQTGEEQDYAVFVSAYQRIRPDAVTNLITKYGNALLETLVPKVNDIISRSLARVVARRCQSVETSALWCRSVSSDSTDSTDDVAGRRRQSALTL
jgi:hypothetical protein